MCFGLYSAEIGTAIMTRSKPWQIAADLEAAAKYQAIADAEEE